MPPETLKGFTEDEIDVWKTEYDVVTHAAQGGP